MSLFFSVCHTAIHSIHVKHPTPTVESLPWVVGGGWGMLHIQVMLDSQQHGFILDDTVGVTHIANTSNGC